MTGHKKRNSDVFITKFLENVASSPNKIAIQTTDSSLSYQALYLEVLHWKSQLNFHPCTRAVVFLERKPQLIAMLLALQWLKITYIPVDISIPIERLRIVMEDSQADVLIYESTNHPTFKDLPGIKFDLSNKRQSLSPDKDPCALERQQNTLAYIIYTSGSTGKPKGVAISYKALNNFLFSMSRYFLNRKHELLLAITTIAFDIAVLELYLPLWQKKTIFLANQVQYKDPFALIQLLNNYPITLLQATPTMWKLLEAAGWTKKTHLLALCGGEPLTPMLAQQLLAKTTALWNLYGPTEATVWCALKKIEVPEPITIGHPIANMQMYVLDNSQKPLPPFVKGELFIGGVGLAEGYVNNEALTKDRFITNKNGRLYRVGDIACTTGEGEFIIFGRRDNQVKLHGYRIELEEIEAQILQFSSVRDCAVAVDNEQLIAYICPLKEFSKEALLSHLAAHLPDYMLPNNLVLLDKLPLSANGKLDRKALVNIPSNISRVNQPFELTSLELTLMQIWSEELGRSSLKIEDNFFSLGGHSLTAARIIAQISQQCRITITIKNFYEAPTIKALVEYIEQAKSARVIHSPNPLNPTLHSSSMESRVPAITLDRLNKPAKHWLPLNDFQLLMWISIIYEPKIRKYNLVERKRLQGVLNKNALDLALHSVFQKHEIFSYKIKRFYPCQKKVGNWSIKWIETTLNQYSEAEKELKLTQSFNSLFYHHEWPQNKPLIVSKLFYLQEDQIELQIAISHLIADEDSLSVFFRDLSKAYHFFAENKSPRMTEPQPFKPHILKQPLGQKEKTNLDVNFWSNYLKNTGFFYFPQKYIATDKKQSNSTYLEIPPLVLKKLEQICIKHQMTSKDVLTAAITLSLLLCCRNKKYLSDELFINIVKSTRENREEDQLIGCFLALCPIKVNLKKDKSLLGLAKQAQDSLLETSRYQKASSLVKFASIGQLPRKKNLQRFLISLAIGIINKISRSLNRDTTLLESCATMASMERKNNFLINVNILNNFFNEVNGQNKIEFPGLKSQRIPSYQYPIQVVESIFDVCFLMDYHKQKHFVVITSNVTPAFRQRFGARLFAEILKVEV